MCFHLSHSHAQELFSLETVSWYDPFSPKTSSSTSSIPAMVPENSMNEVCEDWLQLLRHREHGVPGNVSPLTRCNVKEQVPRVLGV